jgi:hypothetical protein
VSELDITKALYLGVDSKLLELLAFRWVLIDTGVKMHRYSRFVG